MKTYRSFIAMFTLLTVVTSTAAFANDDKKAASVELKFLGNFKKKPVFELSVSAPASEKGFDLNIRDAEGNSLYKETLKSNQINKKFLLNNLEEELSTGNEELQFEVTDRDTKKTVIYKVKFDSKVVSETVINRVD